MKTKTVDENYEGPKQERMIDGIERNAYVMNVDGRSRHRKCPINMRGFLHKNLGRPWSKVYSELCKRFSSKEDREALDDSWLCHLELEERYICTGDYYVENDILKLKKRKTS